MSETTGILRNLGGRLAPPTAAQRSWRLALIALLLLPQTVVPATITVDADVGGVGCDLVEAINSANSGLSADCAAGEILGPDTIELTVPTTLTSIDNYYTYYDQSIGLPVVTSEITINGNGNSIERSAAAPPFRLFAVAGSGTLTLNEATLSGGSAAYTSFGGGPAPGGAVALFYGGALNLNNSEVSGNYGNFGGAIATRGPLTVYNSTIVGNSASDGGGIAHSGTYLATIADSTISGNQALDMGGGIYTDFYGTTSLTNSTVSGNTSYGYGGGLATGEYFGTTTLTNSTLSGNSVTGTTYGANVFTGYYYDSFYGYSRVGTSDFTNTIVANPVGGSDCFTEPGGVVLDNGFNFSEDGTCGAGFAPITTGVDIDGTLADNGGPTLTHALLDGSVALDQVACGLLTDQRGEPRDDGLCDSGSFELFQVIPTCEDSLRDLATYILALPASDFVGSSAARRSILASRAVGAANAIRICAESTALIRLQSLINLVDGIGRDYMVATPNDVTTMAQELYDTIAAGECPECSP